MLEDILWSLKFISGSALFLIFLWVVFDLIYSFEKHIDNFKKK